MRLATSLLLSAIMMSPVTFAGETRVPSSESSMQALSFLSGRWVNHSASGSEEGDEEEYWSPLMGESIVGHFRVVAKGKPGEQRAEFYEFWTIELEDGKAIFKMKHYNHGLIGWEEKADVVRLETRVEGPQNVVFTRPDGTLSLRYERKGDELISALHNRKNGAPHEEVFHLYLAR